MPMVVSVTHLATRQARPAHFHTPVQAFFSACAKMCVRELRKTDTANVSVFYLSFSSTVFATIALTVSWLTGRAGVVIPSAPVDWGLFALVGKLFPKDGWVFNEAGAQNVCLFFGKGGSLPLAGCVRPLLATCPHWQPSSCSAKVLLCCRMYRLMALQLAQHRPSDFCQVHMLTSFQHCTCSPALP